MFVQKNSKQHYFSSTFPRNLTPYTGKVVQIFFVNDLSKETVTAIMMLYKNTKVKVRSPNGDTDYFDIVASVLQGDALAPYLFIIGQDYVLRSSTDLMKENSFKLAKQRSRRYLAQTITDVDYANDIAFLADPCYIPAT